MGGLNVRDAAHKVTRALPNGSANVTSDSIDLGGGTSEDKVSLAELLISAPAMNTTEMPDAKTMKYDIVHSDSSNLADPVTLLAAVITQTGAGGAGCAAASHRWRPPSTGIKRYVGIKATGSASGNATTASLTAELLF